MGRLARLIYYLWLVSVIALSIMACSGQESTQSIKPRQPSRGHSSRAASPHKQVPLYGNDGELLESELIIQGLKLPIAMELVQQSEREHLFYSKAEASKLVRYFNQRLLTQNFRRVGTGAVFSAATVRRPSGGAVKLDVIVLPSSRVPAEVRIIELAANTKTHDKVSPIPDVGRDIR